MSDSAEIKNIVENAVRTAMADSAQNTSISTAEVVGAIRGLAKELLDNINPVRVKQLIDTNVEALVDSAINDLSMDQAWLTKIENAIVAAFRKKFEAKLSLIDVRSLISQQVDSNLANLKLDLLQDFRSTGIVDRAKSTQITLHDGRVTVTNALDSQSISVDQDLAVSGTTTLNNLIVKGVINTDNASWSELADTAAARALQQLTEQWQQDLIRQVVEQAKTTGIDFADVTINGQPILNGNVLTSQATESSIQSLGILKQLTVQGHVSLNDTVTVNKGRLGINTQDPEMALSIWDEEVAISMGKISKDRAFVGTTRLTNLTLGVNRQEHVIIDTDGLTTIKQLRVGQHKIGHAREVPGFQGTKGDIYFNSDPKPGAAFAWVCTGGFNWLSLRPAP